MGKIQKILIVLLSVFGILIAVELVWYGASFPNRGKGKIDQKIANVSLPTPTSFSKYKIHLNKEVESNFNIRFKDIDDITQHDVLSIASSSGVSRRFIQTSLGTVVAGRFKEIKDKQVLLMQGSIVIKVVLGDNIILYRKITGSDKLAIIQFSYNNHESMSEWTKYIKLNDPVLMINVTASSSAHISAERIIIFQ